MIKRKGEVYFAPYYRILNLPVKRISEDKRADRLARITANIHAYPNRRFWE